MSKDRYYVLDSTDCNKHKYRYRIRLGFYGANDKIWPLQNKLIEMGATNLSIAYGELNIDISIEVEELAEVLHEQGCCLVFIKQTAHTKYKLQESPTK